MSTHHWKHWALGGVAAITIMAGALLTTDSASAAAPEPVAPGMGAMQDVQPVRFGPGRMGEGLGRLGEMADEGQALLAEALGISVEELETAMEQAHANIRDERLAEAVADGTLTQEQADAIKELEGLWGGRGFGHGLPLGPRMGEEGEAYLAEALGITVEELQAAKDAAIEAGITQAVADGKITQEQADRLLTGLVLKDYVVDELDGALAAALEKAVADGVITQEQADQILERDRGFFGPGLHGRFGDGLFGKGLRSGLFGGRWGHFGHRGQGADAPETQSFEDAYSAPAFQL